ncbi:hypothetical protein BDM02DRAFT_3125342 [Thelephora ganbajun]|uniref:Uncharacterized protein n=1 Tax=Thelephora ganbajun TaxID=370292 RepID=A0ACB6ZWG0_THEGA|nr:hypothetical protein BDM02DRAFT_3125342 [Thelephora ganbajun]
MTRKALPDPSDSVSGYPTLTRATAWVLVQCYHRSSEQSSASSLYYNKCHYTVSWVTIQLYLPPLTETPKVMANMVTFDPFTLRNTRASSHSPTIMLGGTTMTQHQAVATAPNTTLTVAQESLSRVTGDLFLDWDICITRKVRTKEFARLTERYRPKETPFQMPGSVREI